MEEIQEQLIKYLAGSGWDKELFFYLHSNEFLQLLQTLRELKDDNKRFCPKVQQMFRWLKICPLDQLKAVIMVDNLIGGNMLYAGVPYQAKATRNSLTDKLSSNVDIVENFVRSINKTYKKNEKEFDYDIERWCKQGVLMFPLCCTSRLSGKPHYNLWKNFTARVIEVINSSTTDLPILLVDKKVHDYEMLYSSKNTMIFNSYNQKFSWPDSINEILSNQKKSPIEW